MTLDIFTGQDGESWPNKHRETVSRAATATAEIFICTNSSTMNQSVAHAVSKTSLRGTSAPKSYKQSPVSLSSLTFGMQQSALTVFIRGKIKKTKLAPIEVLTLPQTRVQGSGLG